MTIQPPSGSNISVGMEGAVDVIIVLDLSRSMNAEDVAPDEQVGPGYSRERFRYHIPEIRRVQARTTLKV